jgi:hypothetical protein
MAPHETDIPPAPSDTDARAPLAPRPDIRTGVHWRPGPASAWAFLAEATAAPRIDPER